MSSNFRLVKQFVSNFYHASPTDLAGIVSSTFKFRSPLSHQLEFGDELDYDQYLLYSKIYFNNLRAKHQILTSEDDLVFNLTFILEILSDENGFLNELKGSAIIKLKDCLVDDVELFYTAKELKSVGISKMAIKVNQ